MDTRTATLPGTRGRWTVYYVMKAVPELRSVTYEMDLLSGGEPVTASTGELVSSCNDALKEWLVEQVIEIEEAMQYPLRNEENS